MFRKRKINDVLVLNSIRRFIDMVGMSFHRFEDKFLQFSG